MFETLKKKVTGMIPGTPINIAQQKRKMEKELREKGYSRTHAVAVVAAHFKNPCKDNQNVA